MIGYTLGDIERNLERHFVERGRSYVARGRVSALRVTGNGARFTALVQGTQLHPYRVAIDLAAMRDGVRINGVCSCPVQINCKHVAAALLANLQRSDPYPRAHDTQDLAAPTQEAANRFATRARRRDADEALPDALQHWMVRARQPDKTPGSPHISPVSRTQLLYLLRIAAGVDESKVVVHTATARRLKSGTYSKPAAWSNARNAVHAPASFVTPADMRVLRRLLIESPHAFGDTFELGDDPAAELLPELLDTGRCFWRSPDGAPLVLGEARRGNVRWQFDTIGVQQIAIETKPALSLSLPLAPPWYVDLERAQCGPLDLGVPGRTAQLLASVPPVPPAHVARVSASLAGLDGIDAVALPVAPEIEQRSAQRITPCLHFSSFVVYGPRSFRSNPLGEMLDLVRLTFDYDGVMVMRDSPNVLDTFRDGRILRMHRAAGTEKTAHAKLERLGFIRAMHAVHAVPSEHRYDYALGTVEDWLRFIADDLPELEREGWRIEFDEHFRFRLAPISHWEARVDASGSDWFDLRLEAEIDGKRWDLMPLIIAAMRDEPVLLRILQDPNVSDSHPVLLALEDGRLFPAPAGRLRGVLSVLHELLDAPPAASVRLARLDAARLAHLEASTDLHWQGGEEYRALGRQLTSFRGIRDAAPPEGFGATLRSYQAEGLSWLQFLREFGLNGILADDMGLGKTVQALAHILLEKQAGRLDRPALVVSPTSVLPNWRAEAQRFAPQLCVHVSHGMERKAGFDQLAGADVVLTTYPLLSRDKDILLEHRFHLVVLDEAQVVKNAQTQAAHIVARLQARHRLCMTGTPLENHLGELWSLFNFLMPGFLGDARAFRQTYRTPIEKHGDRLRSESLMRRIRPFILRRTKEQVASELPPKSEIVRSVELDLAQRDLYETVRSSMHQRVRAEIAARGLQHSHIIVLDALLKLRQICCDPRLLKLEAARRVKVSAKLQLLMEMLPELLAEGRSVLLFSQFTSMLALIEEQLVERGIEYAKLTGETANRAQPVKAFQSGAVKLFLISLKAGGTGLNLTAADTVIHYDPWWNPAVENQATDRAHRIGQDKPVFVYKLIVAGSVEEKITSLQRSKAALADSLLSGAHSSARALTAEDISALFEPLS